MGKTSCKRSKENCPESYRSCLRQFELIVRFKPSSRETSAEFLYIFGRHKSYVFRRFAVFLEAELIKHIISNVSSVTNKFSTLFQKCGNIASNFLCLPLTFTNKNVIFRKKERLNQMAKIAPFDLT